ncbi:MAG TPA: hypothetical protein VKR55_19145 [Bradyrhizobium sp.]|uniref:hypothetical protein n=1 Tax=Bradyrhizobium sp. TaxID=376 RepID=UPI002BF275C0|nr:hypothetical protein [Bradyrhizobium sp.]HLZ04250.1 hypothetical protein [Bradyrhizobium sp.]
MLQRIVDEVKDSTGTALRQTSLAAIAVISLFVTMAFLCGAAFVAVLDRYGPIEACLAGAAIFLIVALIAACIYLVRKRQFEARAAARARAATTSLLTDPALIVTGIQIVRALGVKRLVPILALGGLALGLMASRTSAGDQTPAE